MAPDAVLPTDAVPPSTSTDDFLSPFAANHSHSDASLHDMALRMREIYHHPLAGNQFQSSQAHVLDLEGDWLFVATQGPQVGINGGLWVFDASEREKPELVGRLPLFGNLGGDRSMEATEDADFVVLGTEALACGIQLHPWGPGFYLIDVRDKATPKIVDYVPDVGVHSLVIHRINGEDYVFPAAYTTNVFRIDRDAIRPSLVAVGEIAAGHDGMVDDDPVLGKPIFYTAQYNKLAVYDVSDPSAPVEIATWAPENSNEFEEHYSHMPEVFWLDGRRMIAFEMEDWMDEASPIFMLDATDLSDIEWLGTWTNPANMPANGYRDGMVSATGFNGQLTFSTHNPEYEDGTIYLAHYHAGLWMLDVSTLDLAANPQPIGYYLPHDNNGGFEPASHEGIYPKPDPYCSFSYDQVPNVYDLEVENGLVYLVDYHTGLYAVKRDDSVG